MVIMKLIIAKVYFKWNNNNKNLPNTNQTWQSDQTVSNYSFKVMVQNTHIYTIGSRLRFHTNVFSIYSDMLQMNKAHSLKNCPKFSFSWVREKEFRNKIWREEAHNNLWKWVGPGGSTITWVSHSVVLSKNKIQSR